MRTLHTHEWIAVTIAIFVVGFFFIFGEAVVSIFAPTQTKSQNVSLTLQDVVQGTGLEAQRGDRVTVHYIARFVDGRVFDSSYERREPIQVRLGSGEVIAGWDNGIPGMKEGGKRMLTIPPELGYGYVDHGPIPQGSTLIFDIELIKVEKGQ